MSSHKVPHLVTTSWLKEELDADDRQLCLLDTTLILNGGGRQMFISKHIPGARHFDLDRCIKPRPTCARNLPEPECFQDYMRSLGINVDTHVVFYDSTIYDSTKAWWTLKIFGHERVSVLDGGLDKWVADGYETTTEEDLRYIKQGNFEINLQRSRFVEYDDVIKIVSDGAAQIVDVRHELHFNGIDTEPCIIIKYGLESMSLPIPNTMWRGHIPESVHLWMELVLDPDTKCFLTKDKLLKLLADHNVDVSASRPVVTTCYLGHTATLLNMALEICGRTDSKLYYGSWTEYGQLATQDIVECRHQEDPETISDPDKSKL